MGRCGNGRKGGESDKKKKTREEGEGIGNVKMCGEGGI